MNIRLWPVLGLLLVLTALPLSLANAAAKSGLGATFNYQSDTMDDSDASHEHTAGVGVGIDFQFAIGQVLSINPMFWYAFQPSGFFQNTYEQRFFGVEARIWFDNTYIGAHTGYYEQRRGDFLGLGASETGDGTGVGYTIGWEGQEGTIFAIHWDEPSLEFSTLSTDMKGYKIMFGKRFY